MNDLQKGFWGGALRIGAGLARAYRAGGDRAARMGGDLAARRSWGLSVRAGYRPDVAAADADRAARWGQRTGRGLFHGAAAAGAAGAGFAGGRAAMGGREYPGRTDDGFRGERRSGWAAWRAQRGDRAEKAAAAAGLAKRLPANVAAPPARTPEELAKSIAALPLAKRAALADAVESGDVRALSAAFG